MSTVVYLFGPPAVGKSTLMRELTGHCRRINVTAPFHRVLLLPPHRDRADRNPAAVELGCDREGFPGTDCLPYNVHERVCAWLGEPAPPLILGEGDRLADMRFLSCARAAGHTVHAVHVTAPPQVLEDRHARRGAHQSRTWRKGRHTKATNLAVAAAAAGITVTTINADTVPTAMLWTLVRAVPALGLLRPELRAVPL